MYVYKNIPVLYEISQEIKKLDEGWIFFYLFKGKRIKVFNTPIVLFMFIRFECTFS